MSTTPPAAPLSSLPTSPADPNEVRVVSHSNLFYWWPVWAVGFIMALVTAFDKTLMVTVPTKTLAGTLHAEKNDKGEERSVELLRLDSVSAEKDVQGRFAYVLPKEAEKPHRDPDLHMSRRPSLGVVFSVVLLVVIVITNVPLRGMWSVIVIIVLVLGSVIFALAGWWERVFFYLALLDIRINMAGYLLISLGLLGVWLFTLLFFDRQIYIIFKPGQMTVCTEIGGGEKVYDTTGLTLERQRSDLFRHMILGLGSGDLIVRTTGVQSHQFDLPNVLWISSKVRAIEELLRKRRVESKP